MAQHEGVAPLLARSLDSTGWPPEAPTFIREHLRAAYYKTGANNLIAYKELARVLESLNGGIAHAHSQSTNDEDGASHNPQSAIHIFEEGSLPIQAIVLKGAALAATLYPSIALRPFTDLDILVPRDRLTEAVTALKSLGYTDITRELLPGLNRLLGHAVALAGSHARFSGSRLRGAVFPIEVHWNLVGGDSHWYTPSLAWFWEQAQEARLLNCRALVLSPTAHLLYLAAHLMLQHGGARARLIWFYDLDLLIRQDGQAIEWDSLVKCAGQFHWDPALAAALNGARERFQSPVPDAVLAELSSRRRIGKATRHTGSDGNKNETDSRAAWRSERLVRRRSAPVQTRATSTWAAFSSLDNRTRFKLALGYFFPTPSYVRSRYRPRPTWLWPLSYPYRWLDIAVEGFTTLVKLAVQRVSRFKTRRDKKTDGSANQ